MPCLFSGLEAAAAARFLYCE